MHVIEQQFRDEELKFVEAVEKLHTLGNIGQLSDAVDTALDMGTTAERDSLKTNAKLLTDSLYESPTVNDPRVIQNPWMTGLWFGNKLCLKKTLSTKLNACLIFAINSSLGTKVFPSVKDFVAAMAKLTKDSNTSRLADFDRNFGFAIPTNKGFIPAIDTFGNKVFLGL